MSSPRIDVVVPVYSGVEMTRACLESVLAHSGARLGRLIVVDDRGPDEEMAPMLESLRQRAPALRLIVNEQNLGFIGACNRGLSLRSGDVVVLNSDTEVTPGWLDELAGVLESDERIAAVSPLSNNATLCSVPRWGEASPAALVASEPLGTGRVERFTEMPTLVGFCMLLRDTALLTLGAFDAAYGRGYNEENDWCQRARAAGFKVVRANRALVLHLGEASFQGARAQLDQYNLHRLVGRYPRYLEENAAFARSLEAHAAALAWRTAHGRVRVRLEVGRFERSDAAELVATFTEQLRADADLELVEDRADVTVVLGYPDASRLPALLEGEGQLVHAPCELEPLEARPVGSPLRDARAVAFALWSSGAVVLPSKEGAGPAEAIHGRPLPLAWVRPWPLPMSIDGQAGEDLLVSSRRVTSPELGMLLAAWALLPRGERKLRLAVPLERLPAGWSDRLGALGVELESPRPLARLALGVAGLVLPASESPSGLEARAAHQAGLKVARIEGDPNEALRALLAGRVRRNTPTSTDATPWSELFRDLCARGAEPFADRRRLGELLAFRRGSSS